MSATEQITDRIKNLETEQASLAANHQRMVDQFQKTSSANQTRYAQLTGAITELSALKKELNGSTE